MNVADALITFGWFVGRVRLAVVVDAAKAPVRPLLTADRRARVACNLVPDTGLPGAEQYGWKCEYPVAALDWLVMRTCVSYTR